MGDRIILDGGMGTMLQARGLKPGDHPEIYGMEHPEIVEEIHRKYIEAGSNVIYANTFEANGHKLKGTGHTPAEVIPPGGGGFRESCSGRGSHRRTDGTAGDADIRGSLSGV